MPLCLKYGLGLLPWAPLAQGVLAGRYPTPGERPAGSRAARMPDSIYSERVTDKGIVAGARLVELARARGVTPGQMALLWAKDQPAVTAPIFGPRTMEQLQDLLPVLEMSLTDEDRQACDEINPPGSVISDFFNTAWWMKMRLQ